MYCKFRWTRTDRVVSALQPTWLIGLGRARTRDQPVSRRKGYPDRLRGSPPHSSVDAMPDLIVLYVPCQVVGDVTPTPCAPPSKGRPLAPAEAYPAARGVRRQGAMDFFWPGADRAPPANVRPPGPKENSAAPCPEEFAIRVVCKTPPPPPPPKFVKSAQSLRLSRHSVADAIRSTKSNAACNGSPSAALC